MTKSELIQKMAAKFNIQPKVARLVVDSLFENIVRSVAMNEKVILRGFGTFSLKVSRDRLTRNPHTGEKIFVTSKKSLSFKAGRVLHERMNSVTDR